jgi:hypothetical protein
LIESAEIVEADLRDRQDLGETLAYTVPVTTSLRNRA